MALSLFEKLCGRRTEKVYQLENTQITLRVLSQADLDEILRLTSGDDLLARSETSKRPTLARAIVAVDGKPTDSYPEVIELLEKRRQMFPAESQEFSLKVAVEQFLGTLPPSILEDLFKAYGQLQKEDIEKTEQLKKNWVQA
jgi:hypothetical protein